MKGKYAKEKEKANNLFKKLILMFTIVAILAGDFILPVKLFAIAKEIEEQENSLKQSISQSADSQGNESSDTSSIKSADEANANENEALNSDAQEGETLDAQKEDTTLKEDISENDSNNVENSNNNNYYYSKLKSSLNKGLKNLFAILLTFLLIFIILKIPFISELVFSLFSPSTLFILISIIIGYFYFFQNK